MRLLLFCLLTLSFAFARGQSDTLSGLEVLYQQTVQTAKHKADSLKTDSIYIAHHRFGCALYGGIGLGNNIYYNGIAYGAGTICHYKMHTINMYASLTTKAEAIPGQNGRINVFNSNNYGFMYGLGAYGKNFSASGGIGILYNRTKMMFKSGDSFNPQLNAYVPTLVNVYYSKVGACVGAQATIHGKVVGLTVQIYVNLSNKTTNYAFLAGLAIVIR
ncbi:MAG: hypothetical protein ACYDCN_12920 [Bacteroidia bacterium]